MRSEKLGERLGFRFAQLWKLRGHVSDGTVVLAQLFPDAHFGCRCSVTLPGQGCRQRLRPSLEIGLAGDSVAVRADELGDAVFGEPSHRLLATVLGEEPDRRHGEIIVRVTEPGPADVGQQEQLRRAPPATPRSRGSVPRIGLPVGEQGVEVTAHRGGADTERVSHRSRGDRALLQQQPSHLVTSTAVVRDLRGRASTSMVTWAMLARLADGFA